MTDKPQDKQNVVSRDEMNLAEFPLTVLSTRAAPGVKTLEFHDTIRGKNGETVDREWIITGADKFGLPTASDDEVLLGLLKLTVEDGMRDRKVYFTRYELLRILKWTTEGRSYSRLQKALDRLSGVRIRATNAFYDNDSKSHSTKNFGIIDAYEINSGRDGDLQTSFFLWSEVLFKSFQVGFIKKLDLDFYLELKSAVSRRLYRYLDKHFWYKSRISINIFTLCHEKIGISRNYQYASSLRQQIDPSIQELTENGFLSAHEYVGVGKETEVVFHAGKSTRTGEPPQQPELLVDGVSPEPAPVEVTPEEVPQEAPPLSLMDEMVKTLTDRGLSEKQVVRLIAGKSDEVLKRVGEIVAYYDSLRSSGSNHVQKNPLGFLYRAIEDPDSFSMPGEEPPAPVQPSLPLEAPKEPENKKIGAKKQKEAREASYLVARKQKIKALREELDPQVLQGFYQEVQSALTRLKGLISDARFHEAVEHGVDEKLAKHFGVPDFDEWSKQNPPAKK